MSQTALLCCCTLLLQASWTFGSGLRYSNLGKEGSQQSVETNFQRFTRDEEQSDVNVTRDTHDYYRSTYYPPSHDMVGVLWQDLASMLDSGAVVDHFTDSQLSDLHRYYEVRDLKFRFPFYGHILETHSCHHWRVPVHWGLAP
ncbi:hypothetical protein GBAR_LOCUS9936 [Geodia barretti]|uniref:Uncharacterized protein n=1 Tax=Geodia barretti TaxID=519541 RepID=A0AA35RR38_GEOBA|nr:hypothetical protein GBAR_LOCUS9936 [Geodia barretti]